MLSTVSLANYTWLVRPWILEKDLQAPICYTGLIPSCILNHLAVYPQININLTHHQRNFFRQQQETIIKSHNC